jgi:hypothetical protein
MALDKLGLDTVSRSMQGAKLLMEQALPILNQIDLIYNQAGGLKETITDADLAEVPSYSGLTKQELDDGIYALTSGVKGALTSGYNAITQLAVRA